MKITIIATELVTKIGSVEVRVWEGRTVKGTPCLVFIHRIAAAPEHAAEFEQELDETYPADFERVSLSAVLGHRKSHGPN